MMARINLLPHRERAAQARPAAFLRGRRRHRARRRADRRGVHGFSRRRSTTRSSATRFLKSEIAKLDKQINEINKLQRPDRGAARAQAGRRDAADQPRADRAPARPAGAPDARRHLPEVDGAAGLAQVTRRRLRAVERSRLDPDAQHRVLALARQPGAGRDQGRPAWTSAGSRNSTLNFDVKRPAAKDDKAPRQARRPSPRPTKG